MQKQKQDITKQLGPLKEVDVKIRLPEALIDYINEVVIEKDKDAKDLDQYCSEEVVRMMIVNLDIEEDTILRNYIIPRALQTHYYKEIMEKYYKWDMK